MEHKSIVYKTLESPRKDCALPVELTDETIAERKEKVLLKMQEKGLDKLIVYCDVEHHGNFSYLVGFYTRFEEALLVIDKDGSMVLMLGNENLNKCGKARVVCSPLHVSLFSLPNQPNRNDKSFEELLKEAGIKQGQKIGIVGWKHFTSTSDNLRQMYDLPAYILDALRKIVKDENCLTNETALFIGENGVRTINNANEIAHYEYGAALASDCMLDAMDLLDVGVSEFELGNCLDRNGQHTSITTIAAAGERFLKANMFPTQRKVERGVPVSMSVGYSGGSSSRAGYAVEKTEDLPDAAKGYLSELAVPYFNAYVTWLEDIKIGMLGNEMFEIIEKVLPRAEYRWSLCPGHLVAEEEWLSSPIYEESQEKLQSGMLFQIDIIPSQPGMGGVSAESTVVLADAELKTKIQEEYPEMWERMQKRKGYLENELGICLSEDVLPMCGTVGYLRPYLLNKEQALACDK